MKCFEGGGNHHGGVSGKGEGTTPTRPTGMRVGCFRTTRALSKSETSSVSTRTPNRLEAFGYPPAILTVRTVTPKKAHPPLATHLTRALRQGLAIHS